MPDKASPAPLWRTLLLVSITLLTLGYFGLAVLAQWETISAWRPSLSQMGVAVGLALGTGCAIFILAENWHRLVSAIGGVPVPRSASYPSYTTTQLAKYLPGNVLHFVGRHLWLKRQGLANKHLLLATVIETALMALAAACVAACVLLIITVPEDSQVLRLLALLAPIPLAIYALLLAAWLLAMTGVPRLQNYRRTLGAMCYAGLGAALFFCLQGSVFLIITRFFVPDMGIIAIAIAAIAWLVGFVVPGAPGGLGVREAVFLFLLGALIPTADAVLAIAIARLISIVGDLVCFALGQLLFKRSLFHLNAGQ